MSHTSQMSQIDLDRSKGLISKGSTGLNQTDQAPLFSDSETLSTFWKNILSDYSVLNLPQKHTLAQHQIPPKFKNIAFHFDASTSQSMYEFSRQYNSNLFCFFYLNLIETLSALTEKQDIGITTLVYTPACESSPLLLRYKLNPKLSFCEQFNQASLNVLQAYEHKNSNLEALLKHLNLSSPELFQIMISVSDQYHRNMIYLPCKELLTLPFPHHHEQANISFCLQYTEEGIQGHLQYNESLYEYDFIEKLLHFFQKQSEQNLQYFKK